jgi:hypothetical protein
MMARSQGAEAFGPITTPQDMNDATRLAVEIVRGGGVCLIDARVAPGYDGD